MENLEILDFDTNETGLSINHQSRAFLNEAAKWAKFLAIVGFIFLGIFALGALTLMGVGAGNLRQFGIASAWLPGLFSLFFIGLYFFPLYYMLQFANKAKLALQTNSTPLLAESLKNLKSHYKFVGILMIVMLSLYALMFVVSLIALWTNFS